MPDAQLHTFYHNPRAPRKGVNRIMNEILEIIKMIALSLTATAFGYLLAANIRERSRNRRLRRQRLFIYAQLAEAFVEWGGLVPRSTGEFKLKHGGIWHSIAADRFGIVEPRLETIAMGDELRERIDSVSGTINDESLAVEYQEQLENLDRLAFIHTCDGVIGPLPVGWTRHLFALDRKGEPVFPRIEILHNCNPRANRTCNSGDNANKV